ncbi:MAG: DUF4124 domain-containing protein [Thiotrichales bacterium]
MRTLMIVCLLAVTCLGHAEIYRWKDKSGNIIFSDQPPPGQKSEKFQITAPNVSSRTESPSTTSSNGSNTPESPDGGGYETLQILTPKPDESIRANNGIVDVSISLTPSLQVELGHRFRVVVDGHPVREGVSPYVVLDNVERGTHTVQVMVITREGDVLKESSSLQFHIQRFSQIKP